MTSVAYNLFCILQRGRAIISCTLLALLVLGAPAANAAPRNASADKPSLWQVRSAKNTVYLVGSVHLLKEEPYPFHAVFDQSFKQASVLVLEVDPAEMALPSTQQHTITKALLPESTLLQEIISTATFETLRTTATDLDIDINALNRYKPWFVAITLTTIKLQQLGFAPEHGVDVYFYNQALKANKKVLGLESAEYQIGLFADMSLATQELLLKQTIEDLHILEQDFLELIAAWKTGNLEQLEKILLDSFQGFPDIFDTIIVERNKNWVEKIKVFLDHEAPYFIVVGAGHLLGPQGVINLLKQQGFVVKQL